ncbi:MAG: hypothetical protein EDM82_08580 [Cyanobacteria bacterium CYA]|nr:MAG: hypothetical protein EDM82_08580 [Cyanobacteria bacterium CYA]
MRVSSDPGGVEETFGMKRTRHSAEQIVTRLREANAMLAAGRSVAQIIQPLGVSEQTYAR